MFVIQGGSTECEGRNDGEEFVEIRSAMKVMEMTDQEIWDVLKILAALLHLGNIKYKGTSENNMEATSITDQNNVDRVAAILGITKSSFVKALTSKTIYIQNESVTSTINSDQAKDVRDAFCKGIYGKLFLFIVRMVNKAIYKTEVKTAKICLYAQGLYSGFHGILLNIEYFSFCVSMCY